jgi:hypothetical protein
MSEQDDKAVTMHPAPAYALGEDGEMYQLWFSPDTQDVREWRPVPRLPTGKREEKADALQT